MTIPFDYLVYAVGCENQTFGIKGVTDHACFLKELSDADKIRTKLLDCESGMQLRATVADFGQVSRPLRSKTRLRRRLTD